MIDTDGKTKLPRKIWDHTRAVRNAVLDTIREFAKPGPNFIFTNDLRDDVELDRQLFEEIAALSAHRSAVLLPVRLSLSRWTSFADGWCLRIASRG